jgi:hypothetical protein
MNVVRWSRFASLSIALLGLTLCAAAADAYTIYLKDGSRIVAREKYEIQGDRAYIVLENGTRSFLKSSEIDVARTDKANAGNNYGSAYELETTRQIAAPAQPEERRETLDDLIRSGKANPTDRPSARRAETPVGAQPRKGRTASGAVDFSSLATTSFADAALAGEVTDFFAKQGIANIAVLRGTAADHALVRASTDSEGNVFRAIAASAVLLTDVRKKTPTRLAAIELSLQTSSGGKAGQFVMTPDLAELLVAKKLELSQFYVDQLQF